MQPLALLGLGSNLGDRKANLDGAIAALRQMPGVNLGDVSSYHETSAVGGPAGQGAFLNAVATAHPALGPREFLGVLLEIEDRFGRVRTVRWGERTLDLDLLLYGDEVLETPELTLPHPRFTLRRFVLAPAAEVAPKMVEPWTERTVADLLANLDRRPGLVSLDHAVLRPIPVTEEGCVPLDYIFRRLVERLGALRLSWTELAPKWLVPRDPWNAHLEKTRYIARRMHVGRWSRRELSDRWLVANFCLERERLRVSASVTRSALQNRGYYTGPFNLGRYERAADSAIGRALQPTVIVLIGSHKLESALRESKSPVFLPTSQEPEDIVTEIMATCAATRA